MLLPEVKNLYHNMKVESENCVENITKRDAICPLTDCGQDVNSDRFKDNESNQTETNDVVFGGEKSKSDVCEDFLGSSQSTLLVEKEEQQGDKASGDEALQPDSCTSDGGQPELTLVKPCCILLDQSDVTNHLSHPRGNGDFKRRRDSSPPRSTRYTRWRERAPPAAPSRFAPPSPPSSRRKGKRKLKSVSDKWLGQSSNMATKREPVHNCTIVLKTIEKPVHPYSCSEYDSNKNLPCLYCGFNCTDADTLNFHIKYIHHVCKICRETFHNNIEFLAHENNHYLGLILFYKCPHCSYDCKLIEDLQIHVRHYHFKMIPTPFKIVSKYLSYLPSTRTYSYCAYCDMFLTPKTVFGHLRERHNVIKCITCDFHFLSKHANNESYPRYCQKCEKKLDETNNALTISKVAATSFNNVPRINGNQNLLKTHTSVDKQNSSGLIVKLLPLDKQISSGLIVKKIQADGQNSSGLIVKKVQPTINKKPTTKQVRVISARRNHQTLSSDKKVPFIKPSPENSPNRNLPCLYCQEKSSDVKILDEHIKNVHKMCKICDLSFIDNYNLKSHESDHKNGFIHYYFCLCGTEFKDYEKYQEHVKNIHNNKKFGLIKRRAVYSYYDNSETKIQCPYCNIFCKTFNLLENHKEIVHNVFKCKSCEIQFTVRNRICGASYTYCIVCEAKGSTAKFVQSPMINHVPLEIDVNSESLLTTLECPPRNAQNFATSHHWSANNTNVT